MRYGAVLRKTHAKATRASPAREAASGIDERHSTSKMPGQP